MIQHEATKDTKDTKNKGLVVSHKVIGAAIEVHRHLGPGLLESVYEAALSRELWLRDIFSLTSKLPVTRWGFSSTSTSISSEAECDLCSLAEESFVAFVSS